MGNLKSPGKTGRVGMSVAIMKGTLYSHKSVVLTYQPCIYKLMFILHSQT